MPQENIFSDHDAFTPRPALNVLTQYIKDFSFENPGAPTSLEGKGKSPNLNLNLNIATQSFPDNRFDVTLSIDVKAFCEKNILFNVELSYAGLFVLQDIPKEHVTPVLFIECPRLLFPFARQIIADVTRNGGFPPLILDPVNFNDLFQKKMEEKNSTSLSVPIPS